MPDLSATFRRPFAEQVAAWRLRLGNLILTQSWLDVQGNAHDRGFMVAGAAKADLLADLAGAVGKAIETGTTLEEFRRDFREIVARHGWTGWTGEGSAKGEAWRTRTIYRANLATTYAAGRHAQLIAAKYPIWIYKHSGAEHPRLHHLALDGIALPSDHVLWKTHFAPNGWGCGCEIRGAHTPAGIRRAGGDPAKQLPEGWNIRDAKGLLPGIQKGWDHAPGATVPDMINALVPKLGTLPERPGIDLIQSWLRSNHFGRWMTEPAGEDLFPLVRIPEEDAELIGAETQVAMLSADTMAKQLREHPELTAFDYAEAQRAVSEATRKVQDGPLSLIYVFEPAEANGYVLVVKATKTGRGLFVTSFRRLSADQASRDRAVRRLLKKERKEP